MKNDSRNIKIFKVCHRFSFSSYATLEHLTHDYVTLHSLRMLHHLYALIIDIIDYVVYNIYALIHT